jgi:Tfp pilus assembly protein PilP
VAESKSAALAPNAAASARNAAAAADTAPAVVQRETFDYSADSRRDPFISLMTTSALRPTLTDLRLTGILYDLSGRRPVAILRDFAGGQWRVTTGMTLGRMRVSQIKPKTIIFTIEEFGFNRRDSLVLGDSTRARY